MKKALSVLLALVLCFSALAVAFASNGATVKISNPYENIDFEKISQYKTALHTHTNASDGRQTLLQSIQKHVESGFDIVSVSDHGINDMGWNLEKAPFFSGVMKLIGRSDGNYEYLSSSGEFENSMKYEYKTEENGDSYLTVDGDKKILRVPYAIENNAVSVNAHVNSWFVMFRDNSVTTYEDAVRGVSKAGGVCVINHPGEYTKAKNDLSSKTAYSEKDPAYAYYINKYAYLIDKYDACIGIDMNSKGDSRTRYDRILWDTLLERFSRKGKNVFAIASSDAHATNVVDTGFIIALMPSLDSKSLRSALENGEFFAASHCIGNYDELVEIADGVKQYYGETEIYNSLSETADKMKATVDSVKDGSLPADTRLHDEYSVLDSNGTNTAKTAPVVKDVSVNEKTGEITIKSENSLIVRWISNGRLIETDKADDAVFNVNENRERIGDYVRAEIFAEGGIVYTQAFLLNADEKNPKTKVTKGIFVDLGILDFLLAEFRNAFAVVKFWFDAKF